jgi:predicted nucleic acid-binding protein
MLEILLDSVILIDHFNDDKKATRFVSSLDPSNTAISVITRAEILVGFDEDEEIAKVKSLLDQFTLLIIDKEIADKAAELRRTFGWKLPDAFQAALAVNHKLKLATRNTKDFNPKQHVFVEVPYRLAGS